MLYSIFQKLYSIFKTFILYATMPIRLLLVFLVFYIGVFILHKLSNIGDITFCVITMGKIMLYILSINVEISDEDMNKYMQYLHSDEKYLCVFTHITLVDAIVLFGTLPRTGPVMNKQSELKYILYDESISDKLGGILLDRSKMCGTTRVIKERVNNRKCGNSPLYIAPCSGKAPENPGNISEFKSKGAFVNKTKILPILIKYEDDSLNYNGDMGESMLHSYLKIFLVENYKVKIKIGDMIDPVESESVEEYKDRVYNIMNEQYKDM
jgi:1-acyl-sn-glycerol-3-phosphate acyltransferase